jgi:hypothetical protein
MTSSRPFEAAKLTEFARSPLLRKWINPAFLDGSTIRRIQRDVDAKPYMRYAVLDDFFQDAHFREVSRRHRRLRFEVTDLASPFDSYLVAGNRRHLAGELLFSQVWQHYLCTLVRVPLTRPEATRVMMRKHRRRANGFWLHTDHNRSSPTRVGAFIYLNRNWRAEDGGILQFWRAEAGSVSETEPIRWKGMKEVRLDFLERPDLYIEVGTADNELRPMRFSLLDTIVPTYNRLVVCDFLSDAAYHSVSPGGDRQRYDITQRIY